jgi:aminoacrylate hydrolase
MRSGYGAEERIMPKVAVADGEIHYEVSGNGPALIFVSGLNGTGRSWQPQVTAFEDRFRVITYDQRGTGASDKAQQVFSVDGMTAELAALMDAIGIERASIVGQSTGGAIGQTLAIDYPSRVERMVIYSTWTHCDPWFRRLFEARRAMYEQCGPELHARFHPLWLYSPDYVNSHDVEIEAERVKAIDGAPPVRCSVGRINAILAFDRRADLDRIETPTLIIVARDDYITPSYHAEALHRSIRGSELKVFEGGGHSLSRTRTAEFNAVVRGFLTRTHA